MAGNYWMPACAGMTTFEWLPIPRITPGMVRAPAPTTTGYRPSHLLQLRGAADQPLDQLCFRLGIVGEPLGGDLAQVRDRRAHHRRNFGAAPVILVRLEPAADALRPLADGGEALEHGVDDVAVLVEMGAALGGGGGELLGALGLRGDVDGLFQIGHARIDHARARRIPARGLVLEQLDDLVAVPRLLGDQRQRDQPQVALRQHPPGAQHVAVAQSVAVAAVASAPAAAEMAAAPAGPPLAFVVAAPNVLSAQPCSPVLCC